MAMFKMNPMYAGDPVLCVVAGSCVFTNVGAAPINTVVQPALFKASTNALGAGIGQNETVAPQGCKVTHVVNPTTAYSPQVAAGGTTSVVLLDVRAFPGDIVSVHVGAIPPVGSTPGQLNFGAPVATVIGIDQTNNFIYVNISQIAANGLALHYQVFLKDSYTP